MHFHENFQDFGPFPGKSQRKMKTFADEISHLPNGHRIPTLQWNREHLGLSCKIPRADHTEMWGEVARSSNPLGWESRGWSLTSVSASDFHLWPQASHFTSLFEMQTMKLNRMAGQHCISVTYCMMALLHDNVILYLLPKKSRGWHLLLSFFQQANSIPVCLIFLANSALHSSILLCHEKSKIHFKKSPWVLFSLLSSFFFFKWNTSLQMTVTAFANGGFAPADLTGNSLSVWSSYSSSHREGT